MARDRDRDRNRKGGAANDKRRTPKKKISVLTSESIKWIDYKDVNLLRRFMSERAKIRARRVTGNSAQQQRAVARAIRVAREMALLPYSVRQVNPGRKGGRGRDRGDRERDREMPREVVDNAIPSTPPPPPPDGSGVAQEPTPVVTEAEFAEDAS
ncbi:MAG: ribosomal protein [Actinomycetia bacterium]|nr:ribosomal protein [Actinomycetes bacterium]